MSETEKSTPAPAATEPAPKPAGDSANWAKPVNHLLASEMAPEVHALNNVDGRLLNGPMQGFGRMWRKRHHVRLDDVDIAPAAVISTWKNNFGTFWPRGNHFYGPITGLKPGEVALIDISIPGAQRLSTGVLVLYADDESFSLMTPQGHVFAGWITFSSYREAGASVVQADILMRPSDPLYEIGMELLGHRQENRFWEKTLTNVARHFGSQGTASTEVEIVDPHRQWRNAKNVIHNSAIRTGIYRTTWPIRKLTGR